MLNIKRQEELFQKLNKKTTYKKLSEITSVVSGKRLPKGYELTNAITFKQQKYLRVMDMNNLSTKSSLMYVPDEVTEKIKNYKIYEDDIYISVAGTLGIVGKINKELNGVNLTENANRIMKTNNLNPDLLLFYLKSNIIQNIIESKKTLGAQPKLALKEVRCFPIPLYPIDFQNKIANFLTSLDDLIQSQEQYIELLKVQKKGYSQKIFNQKVRFERGKETWEKGTFKKWGTFSKGKDLAKSDLSLIGKNKCVLYGELYTKYNELIKGELSRTNSNKGVISKGNEVLIPGSTTTGPEDIAIASAIVEKGILIGGDINIYNSKKINNIFLAYYITNFLNKEISRYATGTTVVHLTGTAMEQIEINVPSLKEQAKIGSFLSSLDDKIEFQKQKMEQLKLKKKYYLNKIFQ